MAAQRRKRGTPAAAPPAAGPVTVVSSGALREFSNLAADAPTASGREFWSRQVAAVRLALRSEAKR